MKIFNILKNIQLTETERSGIRRALARQISEQKPARPGIFSLLFTPQRTLAMPALVVSLIIAVSGGVSAQAAHALPGDLLHPVKINVNERVKEILARGTEAKADLALHLVDERLAETEKLAEKPGQKAERLARAEQMFAERIVKFRMLITRLEAEGRIEAAKKMRGSLDVILLKHDKILAQPAATEGSADQQSLQQIQERVKTEIRINDEQTRRDQIRPKPREDTDQIQPKQNTDNPSPIPDSSHPADRKTDRDDTDRR